MRDYIEAMLKKPLEKVSDASPQLTELFRKRTGELKNSESYDVDNNVELIKEQEEKYLQRDYTSEEWDQVLNVGTFEKKRSVEKKILMDRKKEFRKKMIHQADISKDLEYHSPIETHAARLMLSLNFLSMQSRYKGTDLGNKMQTTAAMLADIVKFGEKKVDYTPELFKASLYTVTTMFGYVTKNIRDIRDEVKLDAEKKVRRKDQDTVSEAKELVDILNKSAEDLGNTMLHIETKASMVLEEKSAKTWAEIYNKANLAKVYLAPENMTDSGAGTSVVYKLDEGGHNVYFKGKETVPDTHQYLKDKIFKGVEVKEGLFDYLASDIDTFANFLFALTSLTTTREGLEKEEAKKIALLKDMKEKEMTDEETENAKKLLMGIESKINERKMSIESTITQINFFLTEKFELDQETALRISKNASAKEINAVVVALQRAMLGEGADLQKRNFATEHLAFLFDSDDLVVKSSAAEILTKEGEFIPGFVMTEGIGEELNKVNNKYYSLKYERAKKGLETPPLEFTKAARDKFYKLKFMDVLAGQIDRHTGNIMVKHTLDEKTGKIVITDLIGIDNDMSFGNFDSLHGFIVNNEWKYNYCPRDLYECVMTITPELLTINMANYVEPEYMPMLIKRFVALKEALIEKKKKLEAQHKDFFTEKEGEEVLSLSSYNVGD